MGKIRKRQERQEGEGESTQRNVRSSRSVETTNRFTALQEEEEREDSNSKKEEARPAELGSPKKKSTPNLRKAEQISKK